MDAYYARPGGDAMESDDLSALDLRLDHLQALVRTLLDDPRVRSDQGEQLLQRAEAEAEEISVQIAVKAQKLERRSA
jgi:hypothetical protein